MNGQDCEQLTLFQEGSLASRLVLPGSEEAQKMTVISGQKCLELYKNSSPVGLLARMLLGSSTWRSTRCYLTWKISSTPAKRLLFRLVPSMPRTGETAALSWPTPTAADSYTGNLKSTQQKEGSRHSLNLSDAVKLFPTPTARDYKGARKPETLDRVGRTSRNSLPDYVTSLYPTPTTGAGMCGGTGNFQPFQLLKEQGKITEEERRNMSQGNGGQLNPDWVEALMGFPVGWTALDQDGEMEAGNADCKG